MELWDAYDEKFTRIDGITLERGKPIPDGIYHLVCDIVVQHTDGTYLLMQRDAHKHYGGMWEATAGGSALQNESPLECAIRELHEETGIITDKLMELGKIFHPSHHTVYFEFLLVTDWQKNKITLQDGETQSYMWVTRDKLVEMKHNELVTQRCQIFLEELQK